MGKTPRILTDELVRCGSWHAKGGKWRRVCVWVQEFSTEGRIGHSDCLREGHMVGQLQVILTIEDPNRAKEDGKLATYTGALIYLLKAKSNGQLNDGRDEDWPVSPVRTSMLALKYEN
jgi:hypothetical protein